MESRRRILSELPLALGVGLGWLWLWLAGRAFVLDGWMEGYGWSGYVLNAWSIQRRMVENYDYFRAPLHGLLLGWAGEGMGSYADAAILISSLSVAGMVLSAGLSGRALVGPWVGGLAAAVLPLTASTAHAVRWANSYPVLGVTTGGSLAAGLLLARWPHPVLALLTGALTGLATAADGRGMVALPPAILLAILAARHAAGWRRWLILAGLALGLLAGPGVKAAVDWDAGQVPTLSEKVAIQQDVVRRWIHQSADDDLMAGCGGLAVGDMLTRTYLESDCPEAMVRYNLTRRLPRHLPLGALTVLGLLAVLPGGRGWRGAVEGGALLLAAGGMGLLVVLTPMADRYILQFAVLLAVLGPVGLGRLIHTLSPAPLRPWLCAAAMLAVGAWAWRADPTARSQPTALQSNEEKQRLEVLRHQLRDHVGPDTKFLDCSNQQLALSLLPAIPQAGFQHLNFPILQVDDAAACLTWIRQPPAEDALIAVDARRQLRVGMGGSGGRVLLAESLADSGQWTVLLSEGSVQVWSLSSSVISSE